MKISVIALITKVLLVILWFVAHIEDGRKGSFKLTVSEKGAFLSR